MANNELSGPLVLLGLYEKIKKWNNRQYNYHFLINPETIGSICHIHTYKEIYKKDLDSGFKSDSEAKYGISLQKKKLDKKIEVAAKLFI